MNIIKIKDKIKTDDEFFNTYLKGRFAWWVNCKYVVPFIVQDNEYDYVTWEGKNIGITYDEYIMCETDSNLLTNTNGLCNVKYYTNEELDPKADGYGYIDIHQTDDTNRISTYILNNSKCTDKDTTNDDIVTFRSWLPKYILTMADTIVKEDNYDEQNTPVLCPQVKKMLNFYANNMMDDVYYTLLYLEKKNNINNSSDIKKNRTNGIQYTECNCSNKNIEMINNKTSILSSDTYKAYMREIMINTFSDINFWENWKDSALLIDVKRYIDNIISRYLPLTSSYYTDNNSLYTDAYKDYIGNVQDTTQEQLMLILKCLSTSFGYMINDDLVGHKNFIIKYFKEWSEILYESMYWDTYNKDNETIDDDIYTSAIKNLDDEIQRTLYGDNENK